MVPTNVSRFHLSRSGSRGQTPRTPAANNTWEPPSITGGRKRAARWKDLDANHRPEAPTIAGSHGTRFATLAMLSTPVSVWCAE